MPTGPITTPVTWGTGTIALPDWFQNVQDNVNNVLSTMALASDLTAETAARVAADNTLTSTKLSASDFTVALGGVGTIKIPTTLGTAYIVWGTSAVGTIGPGLSTVVSQGWQSRFSTAIYWATGICLGMLGYVTVDTLQVDINHTSFQIVNPLGGSIGSGTLLALAIGK